MPSPIMSTVLVVDDEPMLRYLLARTLADEGYPVIAVENGEQALLLASTLVGQLALVVTDIRMPGMDGLQLARRLAQLEFPPPVLFISGSADDAEVPGPFLAKPFLPGALVEQVGRLSLTTPAPAPASTLPTRTAPARRPSPPPLRPARPFR